MSLALKIPDILLTIFLFLFGQEMLFWKVDCFESFGADYLALRLRLLALFSPDVIVWGCCWRWRWRWRCRWRCCLCCSFEDDEDDEDDDGDGDGDDDGDDDDSDGGDKDDE